MQLELSLIPWASRVVKHLATPALSYVASGGRAGLPGGFRFFGGGESGTFRGQHSVEDHYLHINGINFFGGE